MSGKGEWRHVGHPATDADRGSGMDPPEGKGSDQQARRSEIDGDAGRAGVGRDATDGGGCEANRRRSRQGFDGDWIGAVLDASGRGPRRHASGISRTTLAVPAGCRSQASSRDDRCLIAGTRGRRSGGLAAAARGRRHQAATPLPCGWRLRGRAGRGVRRHQHDPRERHQGDPGPSEVAEAEHRTHPWGRISSPTP